MNLYNNKIQSSIMIIVQLISTPSPEGFATFVLKEIHLSLVAERDGLFSCNCSCKKNRFLVGLCTEEILMEGNMFEYSLETGYYPFDFVKNLFSKFLSCDSIYIYIEMLDRNCLSEKF